MPLFYPPPYCVCLIYLSLEIHHCLELTLVLLVANFEMMQRTFKMFETLIHGYPSESSQLELPNEYQHDRVELVFKKHWWIFKKILVRAAPAAKHSRAFSPSNVEATFVQITRTRRFLTTIKTLPCWHSLGSYPCARVSVIFQRLGIILHWPN